MSELSFENNENNEYNIFKSIITFPLFKNKENKNTWVFNELKVNNGKIILLNSDETYCSELFLNIITGIYKPTILPNNLDFLKYNISYKKRNLKPIFNNTVKNLFIDKNIYNNKYYYILKNYLNIDDLEDSIVKDLKINDIQIISFYLTFLVNNSDIFIFDYPINSIDNETKDIMLNFLKIFIIKENKNVFFVEYDQEYLKKIINNSNIFVQYKINKINNNSFYGSC